MFRDRVHVIPRDQHGPESDDVLYLISTTHNYHVFDNVTMDIETNLEHLARTLHVCRERGVQRFNYISSWFVYGEQERLPVSEGSCKRPRGFYSITKSCAEDLLVSYCKTFGMDYTISRLGNVYGPDDRGASKRKNALAYLVKRMKENKPIDLYYGGDFFRDYMHVDDVCRGIDLVLARGGPAGIYNVGSGVPTRFIDLIRMAVDFLGSSSEIRSVDPPAFHEIVQVKDSYLDTTKLRALGFSQEISIERGIREMCDRL